MGAGVSAPNVTELRSKEEQPIVIRRMSPQQVVLHETIIRALQMVINAWGHYIKDEKKHSQE